MKQAVSDCSEVKQVECYHHQQYCVRGSSIWQRYLLPPEIPSNIPFILINGNLFKETTFQYELCLNGMGYRGAQENRRKPPQPMVWGVGEADDRIEILYITMTIYQLV